MFEAASRHLRTVVMVGAAAALTVGGVAMAQGGSGGEIEPAKRPMTAIPGDATPKQGDVVRAVHGHIPPSGLEPSFEMKAAR
jgi:hypothetical protein